MTDGQFSPRPRATPPATPEVDRWPAVQDALRGLLDEVGAIVDRGVTEFDQPHSLTYRAAEAVIIHFHDIVSNRIPPERLGRLPADLPLAAITATRNILAHNYRSADKTIIWAVLQSELPQAIRAIVGPD